MEDRWIEIKFYYICQDIYDINKEIFDLMDFIQYAHNLTPFDINIVSDCAQRITTQIAFRPTRLEVIYLGAKSELPMVDIKRRVGINNRDYYKIFNEAQTNHPYFYSRFTKTEIEQIKIFVDFTYKFRKVGI